MRGRYPKVLEQGIIDSLHNNESRATRS